MKPLFFAAAGALGVAGWLWWDRSRPPGQRARVGSSVNVPGKDLGLPPMLVAALASVPDLASSTGEILVTGQDATFLSGPLHSLQTASGKVLGAGGDFPANVTVRVPRVSVTKLNRL